MINISLRQELFKQLISLGVVVLIPHDGTCNLPGSGCRGTTSLSRRDCELWRRLGLSCMLLLELIWSRIIHGFIVFPREPTLLISHIFLPSETAWVSIEWAPKLKLSLSALSPIFIGLYNSHINHFWDGGSAIFTCLRHILQILFLYLLF